MLKLETLNYLRHTAIRFFSVEYQNDILTSIRQLFRKSFVDVDAIVKRAAFVTYARVMVDAQHDIFPDGVADDESVQTELFDFIKMTKRTTKSRDEELKFMQELNSHSILHECAASTAPTDDRLRFDGIRMKEIIGRLQSDTKELMELNQRHELTDEFRTNVASIRQELALLK